jgi:GTP-binding protein HflX
MLYETEKPTPTAVLVGFTLRNKRDPRALLEDPLLELRQLVESMQCNLVGEVFQRNMNPESRTFISTHLFGLAKAEVERTKATLLCVDDTLTGTQRANVENEVGCEVLDRTEVILQIFARRAQTAEGMLQVELAQLTYLKSRLRGRGGKELSALGGGIGTRGPGETKLETDRRVIGKRIALLEGKIKQLEKRRETMRKRRRQAGVPMIALVGYTNAGKSTLLNALSGSDAYADNRLFATLDPLTRKAYASPLGKEVLLTDTVGFIERLPPELVAAFRATLEEAVFADLLAVIVDGSDSDWPRKLDVVEQTIQEIGAGKIPRVLVFSKADLLPLSEEEPDTITIGEVPVMNGVRVSAITGEGLEEFWGEVGERLRT